MNSPKISEFERLQAQRAVFGNPGFGSGSELRHVHGVGIVSAHLFTRTTSPVRRPVCCGSAHSRAGWWSGSVALARGAPTAIYPTSGANPPITNRAGHICTSSNSRSPSWASRSFRAALTQMASARSQALRAARSFLMLSAAALPPARSQARQQARFATMRASATNPTSPERGTRPKAKPLRSPFCAGAFAFQSSGGT